MKINHALDFIADLSYRLADESDYEDELEEQFVSLWELVNSFKQEDTNPPAENTVASSTEEEDTNPPAAEEQCVFDWTRKGCVDCDD